jgi:NADPH-dependent curcumin reductase CurA
VSTAPSHTNHQIRLAARPIGLPKTTDWRATEEPVSAPSAGGLLVRVAALSLDPAMRGWMNEGRSYIRPVELGEVMRAGGVGRVVASRNPKFAAGDWVAGTFGVQEYWTVDAEQLPKSGLHKIDLDLGSVTQWLNVLGMPGMTAYFGLLDIGQPKAGETVVVSGAAGAVGQTVGIAGGPAKCEWVVRELGFDACIDYKATAPSGAAAGASPAGAQRWDAVREGLKQHCPSGVDIYFDNVGVPILDAVLARINRKARIVICGAVAHYNATEGIPGPKNYMSLLVNRARMEGMVVFDYAERFPQAIAELSGYLKDGRMKSKEDIVRGGVAAFPATLLKLFSGENFGKLVLQVSDD